MNPSDAKVGQLIKTEYGLATIISFNAPKSVSCIIVGRDAKYKPGSPGYKKYGIGEWIYIQGFNFDKAEIISEKS